jgi:hypothetical protein
MFQPKEISTRYHSQEYRNLQAQMEVMYGTDLCNMAHTVRCRFSNIAAELNPSSLKLFSDFPEQIAVNP